MDLGQTSSLTVAAVRAELAEILFPNDETNPKFLGKLSQVVARFHQNGYWPGTESEYALSVNASGRVVLPAFLEAIIVARIDEVPHLVGGQRYRYLQQTSLSRCAQINLSDEGWTALETDLTAAGTLRAERTSSADDGKEVRFLGYDGSSAQVLTGSQPGEAVTLASTAVPTTQTFSQVVGIQKPATVGEVRIYRHATNALLATIPGGVKSARFHKYLVGGYENVTEILALCKRAPVPFTAEEDPVLPDSMGALRFGLYALDFESKDIDQANKHWASARNLLNEQAASVRTNTVERPVVSPWGLGISGIRRVR